MAHLRELQWLLPPLMMCLVLTGIHGYLGLHVLSRKVIFVDLALAQIAALGSTYAVLLGYDPRQAGQGVVVYLFSLGFTFVGAAVFSLARMRQDRVPQEAFIGIVYAAASAIALLMMARASGEAEHIKEMLVGNVLLVTWPAVGKTALLYAAIGVFHYFFRKPFFAISGNAEAAAASGLNVRLWDFLFYASFGFVITNSVATAGVLLVFSFLVVPAVIAFMFQEALGPRILLAWAMGTVCSAAGMLVSYYGDLPTGPSVVACFAATLVVAVLVYHLRHAERRGLALARIVGVLGVVAGLAFATQQLRRGPEEHAHVDEFEALVTELQSTDEVAQIEAVHHLAELKDPHAVEPLVKALEATGSDRLAEHIILALSEMGEPAAAALPALEQAARRGDDPFLRLEAARALLRLGSPAGFGQLAALLDDEAPALLEQKVGALLKETAGQDFGIGKAVDEAGRAEAKARFEKWLAAKGQRLRWRQDLRRFE